MMSLFGALAIALYLLIAARLGLALMRSQRRHEPLRLLALGIPALLLHGILLYPQLTAGPGLNLSFFHAASLVSWLMVALYLAAVIRLPLENLGIFVLPIAAVTVALSGLGRDWLVASAGPSWRLDLHIVLSILAYSLLGIAALQAVLVAVQNHRLRHHHPGGIVAAMPPLQAMETLLFQMIALGFGLLSLGLLTGFLFLEDLFAQHLVHKTTLSIVSWFVFGTLLWGRWQFGWRGQVAIRWTLAGFVLLMLAYFGSKFVLEIILGL